MVYIFQYTCLDTFIDKQYNFLYLIFQVLVIKKRETNALNKVVLLVLVVVLPHISSYYILC